MADVIKLNVGGTIIQVYKSTLLQLDYFKAKLERWNGNDEKELFVDYDYNFFKHLINKLRDTSYEMPNNKNIINMCNYFGYIVEEQCEKSNLYVVKKISLRLDCDTKNVSCKMRRGTKIIDVQIIPSYTQHNGCDIYFTDSQNNTILTIDKNSFFSFFDRQTLPFYMGQNGISIRQENNMCFLRNKFIDVLQKTKELRVSVKNLWDDELIIYYEEKI
jgi:hypothetical protein